MAGKPKPKKGLTSTPTKGSPSAKTRKKGDPDTTPKKPTKRTRFEERECPNKEPNPCNTDLDEIGTLTHTLPLGIYTPEIVMQKSRMKSSKKVLAGYLGWSCSCAVTTAMEAIASSTQPADSDALNRVLWDVYRGFESQRNTYFGLPQGGSKNLPPAPSIHAFMTTLPIATNELVSPERYPSSELVALKPDRNVGGLRLQKDNLYALHWIALSLAWLKRYADHMGSTGNIVDDDPGQKTYFGYDRELWSKAYHFWAFKVLDKGRNGDKTTKGSHLQADLPFQFKNSKEKNAYMVVKKDVDEPSPVHMFIGKAIGTLMVADSMTYDHSRDRENIDEFMSLFDQDTVEKNEAEFKSTVKEKSAPPKVNSDESRNATLSALDQSAQMEALDRVSRQVEFYYPRPPPWSNPWSEEFMEQFAQHGEAEHRDIVQREGHMAEAGVSEVSEKVLFKVDNRKLSDTTEYRDQFYKFHRQLNDNSANRIDFLAACHEFGISPITRRFRDMQLRAWQITDMSFSAQMLSCGIHYVLNGNDVGTGKTISCLATIVGRVGNTQRLIAIQRIIPITESSEDYPHKMLRDIKRALVPDSTADVSNPTGVEQAADSSLGSVDIDASTPPSAQPQRSKSISPDVKQVVNSSFAPVESKPTVQRFPRIDVTTAFVRPNETEEETQARSANFQDAPCPTDYQDPTSPIWDPSLSCSLGAGPYYPTLLIVPSSVGPTVWAAEIDKWFPEIKLYSFGGNDAASAWSNLKKPPTPLHDLAALHRLFDRFDYSEPSTCLHVIMTTYATLRARTTSEPKKTGSAAKPQVIEDDEDDEGAELHQTVADDIEYFFKGQFGTMILDEGHRNKNKKTHAARAIAAIKKSEFFILSATVVSNKADDLVGQLHMISQVAEFSLQATVPEDEEPQDLERMYRDCELDMLPINPSEIPWKHYMPLLSETNYRTVLQYINRMVPDYASTRLGAIMRPILKLIQTRIVKGTVMKTLHGLTETIASEIPPYKILTVELQFSASAQEKYLQAHQSLGGGEETEDIADTPQGARRRRWKSHFILNPDLNRFRDISGAIPGGQQIRSSKREAKLQAMRKTTTGKFGGLMVKEEERKSVRAQNSGRATKAVGIDFHTGTPMIAEWCGKADYGLSQYMAAVTLFDDDCVSHSRAGYMHWLSKNSPKLQYLAGAIRQVTMINKRKLLLFWTWPMSQWCFETWLWTVMKVDFLSIRSKTTHKTRADAIDAFTNKQDRRMILVTNYLCTSTSANLQPACADVIFCELGISVADILQGIGRLFRIGQKLSINVTILVMNESYDQVIQQKQAVKYAPLLAAQAKSVAVDTNAPPEDDAQATAEHNAYLEETNVAPLYTKLLGQRSSRFNPMWAREGTFREYLTLPTEESYRSRVNRGFFHIGSPEERKFYEASKCSISTSVILLQ
jgi:hypothetical protein